MLLYGDFSRDSTIYCLLTLSMNSTYKSSLYYFVLVRTLLSTQLLNALAQCHALYE